MKRATLILAVLFLFFQVSGQKLNKTFYLLGTLSDYMGRYYAKNNPHQWAYIMTLHQDQMLLIKRIEEVTGIRFKRRKKQRDCTNCQEFYELKSFIKAKRINNFYQFKKLEETDSKGHHFYAGELDCNKLNDATAKKQLSFLAGLFLTHGRKEGDKYKFSLSNALWKFECVKQLLQKLGAEVVTEEITKNTLPVAYNISFIPSAKLKVYFEAETMAISSTPIQ